jgi:hypothetical protein
MAEMIVMAKGAAQMNVSAGKVEKFLADGWVEVQRYEIADPDPAPITETEAAPAVVEPVVIKHSRKAKAKS